METGLDDLTTVAALRTISTSTALGGRVEIEVRLLDDRVLIRLWDEALESDGGRLRVTIDDFLQQGYRQFVLDLGLVPHVDSGFLGEIVRAYTTVSRQGGTLKLRNLPQRIRDLLSWWPF